MSTVVGTLPLVSLVNKPIRLCLSSKSGLSEGTSLSSVDFAMNTGLQSFPGYTASFEIESMTFYNTFSNIMEGKNKLKILSAYTSGGQSINNIIEVEVPQGHYDITSLLLYLNESGVCNDQDSSGFYYGLGTYGSASNVPFETNPLSPSQLKVNFPTYGQDQSALGQYNANHIYFYFGFIVDDETQGLMEQMGLLEFNSNNQIANTSLLTFGTQSFKGIFVAVQNNGASSYYNYGSSYTPPGSDLYVFSINAVSILELGGPEALLVSIDQLSTPNRISTNGLNTSSMIGVVPVTSGYGYRTTYLPHRSIPTYVGEVNLSNLSISIQDAADESYVDFQNNPWVLVITVSFAQVSEKEISDTVSQGYAVQNQFNPYTSSNRDPLVPYNMEQQEEHGSNKRMRSLRKT